MTKKILVSMLALFAIATTASAAVTKYGIWVGGVEVTSDNAQNFTSEVCPSLEKGTVEYDVRSNTLILKDVHISRWGGGVDAIANTGCPGLRIRLEGSNIIYCAEDCVLRLEKSTTIECAEGSSSSISMRNYSTHRVIYMPGANLIIEGSGKLTIDASSSSSGGMRTGIEGKNATETLTIAGPDVTITDASPGLLDLGKVFVMGNSALRIKPFVNTDRMKNVKAMELVGNQHIVWPTAAAFDAGKKSITVNGTPVTEEIFISGEVIELRSEKQIADANFRKHLEDTYANGKVFLWLCEAWAINSMDVKSKEIATLKGIEYFKKLTTLSCYNNNLTELDISENTLLTSLQCFKNKLTTLKGLNKAPLEVLYCYDNQLKELDVQYAYELQHLMCDRNQLKQLKLVNSKKLASLVCSSNQLPTLDVAANTALLSLYCDNNQLSKLDLSANTVLNNLRCYGNKINIAAMQTLVESLPEVNNGTFIPIDTKNADEKNCITPAQVNAAKRKGWNVYNWNGNNKVEYAGGYSIAASPNNENYGTVTGAGFHEKGKSVTLTATPNKGYKFVKWVRRNNYVSVNTNATYTFTASADVDLVAVFEKDDPKVLAVTFTKATTPVSELSNEDKFVLAAVVVLAQKGKLDGYSVGIDPRDKGVVTLKKGTKTLFVSDNNKGITVPSDVTSADNINVTLTDDLRKALTTDLAQQLAGYDAIQIKFDTTTGLTAVESGQLTVDSWYSIDGKRLSGEPTRKGVYIVNGKKVVK